MNKESSMRKNSNSKIDFSTLTDADLARLAKELQKRGRGDDTIGKNRERCVALRILAGTLIN